MAKMNWKNRTTLWTMKPMKPPWVAEPFSCQTILKEAGRIVEGVVSEVEGSGAECSWN